MSSLEVSARILVCAALVGACGGSAEEGAGDPPNIVLFLADDLGWNSVGYHGGPVHTPNIDALAAAGMRLDSFYVQPTCSPTRAALLTGRYPIRTGFQEGILRPWANYGLPTEETLLAEVLRDAGYSTAIVGKWHLGHLTRAMLPTSRGFDHQYGFYGGTLDYITHDYKLGEVSVSDWNRDDEPLDETGYVTDLLGLECERLIRKRDSSKPLFLYVPFSAPHMPLQVPAEVLQGYAGQLENTRFQTYAAMVTSMDAAIGRVLGVLEEEGMSANTVVIFASDNGAPDEFEENAPNAPLRGGKGSYYEGGVRAPAIVVWPDRIRANEVSAGLVHIVDLFPTLVSVAGAKLDRLLALDGVDISPLLFGSSISPRDELLLNANKRGGALRRGRWKLVHRMRKSGIPRNQLFDIETDPVEANDVSEAHPTLVAELFERLAYYRDQARAPLSTRDAAPDGYVPPARWGH